MTEQFGSWSFWRWRAEPPTRNFCSKATDVTWYAIKLVGGELLIDLKAVYDFWKGFINRAHEGSKWLDETRSTALRGWNSITRSMFRTKHKLKVGLLLRPVVALPNTFWCVTLTCRTTPIARDPPIWTTKYSSNKYLPPHRHQAHNDQYQAAAYTENHSYKESYLRGVIRDNRTISLI